MKSITQYFLASLVFIKILICVVFVFQLDLSALFSGADAVASEPATSDERLTTPPEGTTDDENISLEFLVRKMNRLKEKERALEKRNAELLAFQAEIDQKIEKLNQLRNEIKSERERKQGVERQKIKHLIKAYSAMKPQSAAIFVLFFVWPFDRHSCRWG